MAFSGTTFDADKQSWAGVSGRLKHGIDDLAHDALK